MQFQSMIKREITRLMKGIILVGGNDMHLYPITKGINNQLILIFNKLILRYPTLVPASIREILKTSTLTDLPE